MLLLLQLFYKRPITPFPSVIIVNNYSSTATTHTSVANCTKPLSPLMMFHVVHLHCTILTARAIFRQHESV
jgi:hypothetical protein